MIVQGSNRRPIVYLGPDGQRVMWSKHACRRAEERQIDIGEVSRRLLAVPAELRERATRIGQQKTWQLIRGRKVGRKAAGRFVGKDGLGAVAYWTCQGWTVVTVYRWPAPAGLLGPRGKAAGGKGPALGKPL